MSTHAKYLPPRSFELVWSPMEKLPRGRFYYRCGIYIYDNTGRNIYEGQLTFEYDGDERQVVRTDEVESASDEAMDATILKAKFRIVPNKDGFQMVFRAVKTCYVLKASLHVGQFVAASVVPLYDLKQPLNFHLKRYVEQHEYKP